MPSASVEEVLSTDGASVIGVSLSAPDCWATRMPRGDGGFFWRVGWRWKDNCPPHGRISCPEEYSNVKDLPSNHFESLCDELSMWFENGWIVVVPPSDYSQMKCVMPLVLSLSAHKSTTLRPCHDYSILNQFCVTAADDEASACNVSLRSWREFSEGTILDIKKAYLSLRVDEPLTWYQCFKVPAKCIRSQSIPADTGFIYLRLLRCGFGQSSSPRLLKMVTDYALRGCNIKKYFDDVCVPWSPSESPSHHQRYVESIRTILAKEDLQTKEPSPISESRILGLQIFQSDGRLCWRRRVDIAEFVQFGDKIRHDHQLTYQDCSSFLGQLSSHLPVLGWLRPVTALGKRILGTFAGNTKASWRRTANESIKNYCLFICDLLRNLGDPGTGIWCIPPKDKPLHCFVDSSDLALGVVICDDKNNPLEDECRLRAVDASTSTKPSLHINVAELDATIFGLQKCLAFGHHNVVLYTDSKSVAGWLHMLLENQRIRPQGLYKSLIIRRLHLIRAMISENELSVSCVWVKSEDNVSDRLTRLPVVSRLKPPIELSPPFALAAASLQLGGEEETESTGRFWPSKDELLAVYSSVSRPFLDRGVYESEGMLYYKDRFYLPVLFRDVLIRGIHCSHLHAGSAEVERTIKQVYDWPCMRDDIGRVISQCPNPACERNKAVVPKLAAPSPRRLSHKCWWCVAVDVFHVEGVPVLSIIDEFSRLALVRLLAAEKADDAYEALVGCFECPLFGYPAYVRSDRGIFVSLRERLLAVGVVLVLTSGYRPTANAVVERLHSTIRLRLSVLQPSESLSVRLSRVIRAYNSSPHSALEGSCPAEVFLGRCLREKFHLPVPVPDPDVPPNLPTFKTGDFVWLLRPASERRSGNRFYPYSYKVVECSPYAYKLLRVDGLGRLVSATVDRLVLCRQQPNSSTVAAPGNVSTSTPSRQVYVDITSSASSSDESDRHHVEISIAHPLPRRNRHPPVRFEPGGNPRQVSFDSAGYSI